MNDFLNLLIICWMTLVKQISAIIREVRAYLLGLLREKEKI